MNCSVLSDRRFFCIVHTRRCSSVFSCFSPLISSSAVCHPWHHHVCCLLGDETRNVYFDTIHACLVVMVPCQRRPVYLLGQICHLLPFPAFLLFYSYYMHRVHDGPWKPDGGLGSLHVLWMSISVSYATYGVLFCDPSHVCVLIVNM